MSMWRGCAHSSSRSVMLPIEAGKVPDRVTLALRKSLRDVCAGKPPPVRTSVGPEHQRGQGEMAWAVPAAHIMVTRFLSEHVTVKPRLHRGFWNTPVAESALSQSRGARGPHAASMSTNAAQSSASSVGRHWYWMGAGGGGLAGGGGAVWLVGRGRGGGGLGEGRGGGGTAAAAVAQSPGNDDWDAKMVHERAAVMTHI